MEREELTSIQDSLKLSATIAAEARDGEVQSVLQKAITEYGYTDIAIEKYNSSNPLQVNYIPSFTIYSSVDPSTYSKMSIALMFDYDSDNATFSARFKCCNFNYKDVTIADKDAWVPKFMKFAAYIIDTCPKFNALVKDPGFLMYLDDIKKYNDAINDVKEFDKVERLKKIDSLAESFKAGDIVKIRGWNYPIEKVAHRRLIFDKARNKCFFAEFHRQSLDKKLVATRIVDDDWILMRA